MKNLRWYKLHWLLTGHAHNTLHKFLQYPADVKSDTVVFPAMSRYPLLPYP